MENSHYFFYAGWLILAAMVFDVFDGFVARISRTASDFGKNGAHPAHPELLDWLATQFVERKWSIKAMHRLMLASSAYQQSTAHPEWKRYADLDPDNELLWRMNSKPAAGSAQHSIAEVE